MNGRNITRAIERTLNTFKRELKKWPIVVAISMLLLVLGFQMNALYSNFFLIGVFVCLVVWFYTYKRVRSLSPIHRGIASSCFVVIVGAILVWLFWITPLPSKDLLSAELQGLVQKKSWGELHNRLDTLEESGEYHDLWLLYSGTYAFVNRQERDPELYLSLISPESEYFDDAQWLRLRNFIEYRADSDNYRQQILESLRRSRYYKPVYYRIAVANQSLRHGELVALFGEFKKLNGHIYDFNLMQPQIKVQQGVPSSTSLLDFWAMPGMVALFAFRLAETAHNECLADKKREAFEIFDKVVTDEASAILFLDSSFKRLWIKPELRQIADDLRTKHLPCEVNAGSRKDRN